MFTGIVNSSERVTTINKRPGIISIGIALPATLRTALEIGASVSVDGVCLTVTDSTSDTVFFDIIEETQRVTTLGSINVGDLVHIERSLKKESELGGHIVSGHVDGVAVITSIDRSVNGNIILTIAPPPQWMRYIFRKGFISLHGVSLTVGVVNKHEGCFSVYLIPETIRRTTLGNKNVGSLLNFEIERSTQIIVDTVIDFLSPLKEKITIEGGNAPWEGLKE